MIGKLTRFGGLVSFYWYNTSQTARKKQDAPTSSQRFQLCLVVLSFSHLSLGPRLSSHKRNDLHKRLLVRSIRAFICPLNGEENHHYWPIMSVEPPTQLSNEGKSRKYVLKTQ